MVAMEHYCTGRFKNYLGVITLVNIFYHRYFYYFGDSSLNFNLRIWTVEYTSKPRVLKSQLYYEIFKRFSAEGIEIPFPQRDLHIRSGLENKA